MNPSPEALSPAGLPPDGPIFQEPWEARVFALVVSLGRAGLFTWAEWTGALAERTRASLCGEATYDVWLDTLETLLITKAETDRAVLDRLREAWRAAAEAAPHGRPIVLPADVLTALASPNSEA